MKRSRTDLFIHLLVALAVSLVVNFSYLLLLFESQRNEWRPRIPRRRAGSRARRATASTCR